jgi:hypothetical protein
MRKVHGWAVLTVAVALGGAACGGGGGKSGDTAAGGGYTATTVATKALGDPAIKAVDVLARTDGARQPVDAAPSPDGTVVYYVATGDGGAAGAGAGVFKVAAGGAVSTLAEGAPLVKPSGVAVATDGSRLYIADRETPAADGGGAGGGILTLATDGTPGAPTLLAGTQGRSPRGLDVVRQPDGDVVYFTGTDPANGSPGLFMVPSAGGTVVTVAEGGLLASPDSVVVAGDGVAYVTDQGAGAGQGTVLRLAGGTATAVLSGLHLGSPAGVTLAGGDTTLLVSSLDATTLSDQVLFLELATGTTAVASKVIGSNINSSGGLHRAHDAALLAWADVSRSGRVYRVAI